MNVTPLIDVLLVLIIVFMVVVIEQRPTGLQTELPQQPNPNDHSIPPPNRTIVIQIHPAKPGTDHPRVMVNEESVEWDRLRERLRDIFAIRVERIAYLEADNDIDFQDRGRRDRDRADRRRRPRGPADRGRKACADDGVGAISSGTGAAKRVQPVV